MIICLILTIFLAIEPRSTSSQDATSEYVVATSTPCDEIRFLNAVISKAENHVDRISNNVKAQVEQLQQLIIIDCGNTSSTSNKALKLLIAETVRRAQQASAQQSKKEYLTKAITVLKARVAQTRLLIHKNDINQPMLTGGSAGENLANYGSGSNQHCTTKTSVAAAAFDKCSAEAGKHAPILTAANNLRELKQLKFLDDKHASHNALRIQVLNKGTLTVAGADQNPGFCMNNGENVAGGSNILGVTAVQPTNREFTMTAANIGVQGNAGEQCKTVEGHRYGEQTNHVNFVQTAQAICTIRDNAVEEIRPVKDEQIEKLIADGRVQDLAQLILEGNTKKGGDENAKKEIATKVIGADKGSIQEIVLKPMFTSSIKYKLEGSDQEYKLSSGPSASTAPQALAACYSSLLKVAIDQNAHKQKADRDDKKDATVKTAENKKDGDKKDEVCTGAEEGKCDKEKCTWNKEKNECEVKEGAAVISAVIKAPLLLASLLP
uniref:Variant surface glycoprotein 1125.4318 n=1 Tax=Trypanosoma brucei TaxID=5691 RepID=A0A1J0RAT6_9TRYP|nr:variant surface glycoprotein 1125.4318 [Trypanosoma brucei]